MNLLVDMNLSPDRIPMLQARNWNELHWSEVGAANAPDTQLMNWARENDHAVITQDLDFPQLLFRTGDHGPSVLLHLKDEFDPASRENVFRALRLAEDSLNSDALLTISGNRARIRKLPIR